MLQGECPKARDNKLIGKFRLKGIRRAPRVCRRSRCVLTSMPTVSLKVSAKDLGTGQEQHIVITSTTNMSEKDIRQAELEAADYEQKQKFLRQKKAEDGGRSAKAVSRA